MTRRILVVAALCAGALNLTAGAAAAGTCVTILPGDPCPEEPTTTSTTAAPTTTAAPATTAAPPTTARPTPTTSRPTTTVPEEPEETVPEEVETTTSTSLPALLEEGPPLAPGATAAPTTTTLVAEEAAATEDDDDTGRTVTLVVTALVALGSIFGLLTFWYWRRTRPLPAARARPAPTA